MVSDTSQTKTALRCHTFISLELHVAEALDLPIRMPQNADVVYLSTPLKQFPAYHGDMPQFFRKKKEDSLSDVFLLSSQACLNSFPDKAAPFL